MRTDSAADSSVARVADGIPEEAGFDLGWWLGHRWPLVVVPLLVLIAAVAWARGLKGMAWTFGLTGVIVGVLGPAVPARDD